MERRDLVAGAVRAVGEPLAILRRRKPLDRRQAGLIQAGRIDQDLVLAFVSFPPVHDRLVLIAFAFREEIPVGAYDRTRDRTDLHERPQALVERLSAGQVVQHRPRVAVLRVGPAGNLRRDFPLIAGIGVVAFEPAVAIGDGNAVERLLDRFRLRRGSRRRGARHAIRARGEGETDAQAKE
jgi:hypothetical protein